MIELITIVIPVHNEASNIKSLLNAIMESVSTITKFRFEILFVDDGSTDNTLECIKSLYCQELPIGYIKLSRNFGHQYALQAGLKIAHGEAVITMDGDLQHPPEMIPEMVELYSGGAEVVQMRRVNIGANFRGWVAFILYSIFKKISDVPLVPNAADFRLMSRKIVTIVNQSGKGLLLRIAVPSVAHKIEYINYHQNKRFSGSPSYNFFDLFELGVQALFKYTTFPAKASFFSGVILLIISLSGVAYSVLQHLVYTISCQIMLIFCFIGGMMLISLGIICWYLYFIFEQSRSDSIYTISEIVEPLTIVQDEKLTG